MIYQSFDQLFAKNNNEYRQKQLVAVMAAEDAHTLEAVSQAAKAGTVDAILVGDKAKIHRQLALLDERRSDYTIIHADNSEDVVLKAARLVKDGQAHFLMKGFIQTGEMMKVLLSEKCGFRTDMMMSHLSVVQIPNYHKLIGLTDAALCVYPDLKQKSDMIKNAVRAMLNMGFDTPKVAVLAAVEQVNPKMQETVDAAELKRMNAEGLLPDCVVDGPLSYDLVMSREAAELKGIDSPVCGDADLMVVPNLAAGNILLKALRYSAGAVSAGVVLGGKVPLVLTSRAAETTNKYLPILLAAEASRFV
ncbi:MAG: phosphate acyltransferase [Negativicutes bacterium]|nr:phosphate acyltransferase [Negativicutes bacterium]